MIAGHEKVGKKISLYVSLVALLWSIIMISVLGILGAIISLILARTALSLLSFVYYQKALKKL